MNKSIDGNQARFIKRQLSQIGASVLLGILTTVFLWTIDIFAQQLHTNQDNNLLLSILFVAYACGLSLYMGYLGLIIVEEHRKRIIRDLYQATSKAGTYCSSGWYTQRPV